MPITPCAAIEAPRDRAASPEAVVLRCAAARNSSDSLSVLEEILAAGQPDWDGVLAVAEREAVLPLLARPLLTGYAGGLPPERFRSCLHERFLQTAAAGTALGCELGRVMTHLRECGVAALAFKGPVLAIQLYGSPCWRQSDDLDILVPPRDWLRAIAELEWLGYRKDRAPDRFAKHELRMIGEQAIIDLHHRLMPRWCGFRLDFDDLFARAEQVAVCGTAVSTLCSEDLLLVLCVHAAKHGWTHLKWAADIAELLHGRQALDWTRVFRAAHRLRANRRLLVGIAVATRLFEIPLPPPVDEALGSDPKALRLAAEICAGPPASLPYWARIRLLIGASENLRGRLLVWLHLLRLTARLTEADRAGNRLYAFIARPARLLRVHGPAIARTLRTTLHLSRP
jgi:hypothetical protein